MAHNFHVVCRADFGMWSAHWSASARYSSANFVGLAPNGLAPKAVVAGSLHESSILPNGTGVRRVPDDCTNTRSEDLRCWKTSHSSGTGFARGKPRRRLRSGNEATQEGACLAASVEHIGWLAERAGADRPKVAIAWSSSRPQDAGHDRKGGRRSSNERYTAVLRRPMATTMRRCRSDGGPSSWQAIAGMNTRHMPTCTSLSCIGAHKQSITPYAICSPDDKPSSQSRCRKRPAQLLSIAGAMIYSLVSAEVYPCCCNARSACGMEIMFSVHRDAAAPAGMGTSSLAQVKH